MRRGSEFDRNTKTETSFYSSPSCDGDLLHPGTRSGQQVSILPRLATGIIRIYLPRNQVCFYSSPSCDGDQRYAGCSIRQTGFLFFPVLRRGSQQTHRMTRYSMFLFFPVLRRGSALTGTAASSGAFLFFPVLRRGSDTTLDWSSAVSFYSSPSCDGDPAPKTPRTRPYLFLFFPVLRRGSA